MENINRKASSEKRNKNSAFSVADCISKCAAAEWGGNRVRAVIDQCSQRSLVAESLVQQLGLRKIAIDGGEKIIAAGGVGMKTKFI